MSRTVRLFKFLGFSFAALLALSAALVVFALTPWGLKTCIAVAQKALPELSVTSVEGTIANARLAGVSFKNESVSAEIANLELAVSNLRPLDRHIDIGKLRVDGLKLSLAEASESSGSPEQTNAVDISLPFSVRLENVEFSDFDLSAPQADVTVRKLSLAVEARQKKAVVETLDIAGLFVTLPQPEPSSVSADAQTSSEPIAVRLRKLFSQPLISPVTVPALPISIEAKSVTLADVQLNNETVLEKASVSFLASPEHVEICQLQVSHPLAEASAHGTLELGGALQARLATQLQPRQTPLSAYALTADLALDASGKISVELQAASGGDPLVVKADILAAQANPTFRLTAAGRIDLSPLKELIGTEATLHDLDLQLEGEYAQYEARVKTKLETPLLAQPAEISVAGDGRELSLSDVSVNARVGQNSLQGSLNAALTDTEASVSGTLKTVWAQLEDFAALTAAELPATQGSAQVTFKAKSAADFSAQTLKAEIDSLTAQASLNGIEFTAQASGSLQGTEQIAVKNLVVKAADAVVRADAALQKERLSGSFSIRAKDLSRVDKTLRGRIEGSGSLGGTLSMPQLTARIHADALQAQDIRLKQADVSALISSVKDKNGLLPKADIKVTAVDVVAGEQSLKSISAVFSGTEKAHSLTLDSDGSPVALNARLQGQFERSKNLWKGSLLAANLKTELGTWSADGKPTLSVDLNRTQVDIQAHCWNSRTEKLEVCLKKDVHAGSRGEVALEIKNAEIALLKDFLPRELDFEGQTDALATLSWSQPDVQHAQARVSITGTGIGMTAEARSGKQTLRLEQTQIEALFTPQKARIQSTLALESGGALSADVSVSDPLDKKELSGRVEVRDVRLERFNPILGSVSDQLTAKGELSADIRPGGTLKKPALYGSVNLNDFSAQGQAVPLDMKSSNVTLHFEGEQSELVADLNTEQGTVSVTGSAEWSNPDQPTAKIAVKGDRVRVSMPPYVTAHVTPDVQAYISLQNLKLSGSIRINQARITINDLPTGAVSASEDEEIITPEQVAVRVRTPLRIESSLVIHLGEEVNLSAFGLKSELQGDVVVMQSDQNLGLNGTIRLVNGTFKAYGQDLVINKGNLTFAGPIGKPMLDFEAIRNPDTIEDNVTAGIRIKGPSDAPQTELFTDPAMSQANAMSYILRGQGLDTAADGDNAMLTSALLGLGLSQTGQLVSGIGQMLRISELNISTEGSGNDSQLVVSGYVLPGLQVKYAMGIFDSIATLTLRYRLIARLFVEASSGTAQSLDLLYSFEF